MKRSCILLLSLCCCYMASAQAPHRPVTVFGHQQIVNNLLQAQNTGTSAPGARTTAGVSMERVIAQSTRDNTLNSLVDSVNLKYGSNRGSYYDYNTMIYPYNYPYNTSPMFNYAGMFTRPQVLFDTLRRWTVNPNTLVYGYYETDLAAYDAALNLTNFKALYIDSSTTHPNQVCANTFTTANNISLGYTCNWVAGSADSAFKQYFTYNTANKLTKDSTYELHLGVWRIVSKTFYTYDVSNNLTQIDQYVNTTDTSFLLPLIEQLRYINTYDGSNRLATVQADYYNGSVLTAYVRDTFAYSGTYTWHNSWKEYQWDAINSYWNPNFYMTKVIGVSGLPDTVLIKTFDSLLNSWVPQTMDVMHYNAANNPDTLKDYEYNFTAYPPNPDFTTKYYYETYLMALDASKVTVADNTKVFPNPASGTITITGLNATMDKPITCTILDAGGRVCYRESRYWKGEAKISMRELTPGTYWLSVSDDGGNVIHSEAVVKQ